MGCYMIFEDPEKYIQRCGLLSFINTANKPFQENQDSVQGNIGCDVLKMPAIDTVIEYQKVAGKYEKVKKDMQYSANDTAIYIDRWAVSDMIRSKYNFSNPIVRYILDFVENKMEGISGKAVYLYMDDEELF